MHIENDSRHLSASFNYLNEIRNVWMQILAIRKGFEAFECKFEPFQPNSNHSNEIQSIWLHILTIVKEV